MLGWIFALALASTAVTLPNMASAHPTGAGKTIVYIQPDPQAVDFLVSVNVADLGEFLRLDSDGDGKTSRPELERGADSVEAYIRKRTIVLNGATPCLADPGRFVALGKPNEINYAQTFRCASALTEVELSNRVLFDDRGGHRHLAKIQLGDAIMTTTFTRDFPTYTVTVPSLADPSPAPSAPIGATISSYGWSGVTHILGGLDHVLFILALLVVAANARTLAAVVTAFTLGHSLTLALAATGTVTPPAAIIEPLIALTIIYVGIENLVRHKPGDTGPPYRFVHAGVFGAIHGFGFASVLRDDVGLPTDALLVPLLSFNVGVEVGQLAIALTAWPLLHYGFKRFPEVELPTVRVVSVAVAVVAGYWFVVRVLG